MLTYRRCPQIPEKWQTIIIYFVTGALYGATWAVLLLSVSASGGGEGMSAAWFEQALNRASIGLWAGAIAGSLAGLIGATARLGIEVDHEPWSSVLDFVVVMVTVVAVIGGLYSLILEEMLYWLAWTGFVQMQNANGGFAMLVILLGHLVPAFMAIRLLHASQMHSNS